MDETLTVHCLPQSNSALIWHLELSKCLNYLATCSADNSITIYSLPTLTHYQTIQTNHQKSIRHLSFSPHNKILATCGFSKEISIQIFEKNEQMDDNDRHVFTLDGPAAEIKHVEFNLNGDKVLVCCRDGSIWMQQIEVEQGSMGLGEIKSSFMLKEPECIAIMEQAHSGDIKCIRFLNEYETISVGFEEQIKIHTENDCEFEMKVSQEFNEVIKSTLWTIEHFQSDQDQKQFLVGHSNGIVSFLKQNYHEYWFKLVTQMKIHSRDVYSIAQVIDDIGKLKIITAGGDNCIKISQIDNIFDNECKIRIENNVSNKDFEVNSVIVQKIDEKQRIVQAGDDFIMKYIDL